MAEFGFNEFKEVKPEEKEKKKVINFQELPKDSEQILSKEEVMQEKYSKEEQVMPYENNQNQTHLSTILSPNLAELEMMIRGMEFVKRWNPLTKRDEVILRKIKDHPLNEYGVNKILELIRVFIASEIKLGRRTQKDAIESAQQVGMDARRLIYGQLKDFGMDTRIKQKNAKIYCLAIFELVYSALSRSIEGRENDASRPTEFTVQGLTDSIDMQGRNLNKQSKNELKN